MTRREAMEGVTAAITQAYVAGCDPREVAEAIEFGCRDGNRLDQAALADRGLLFEDAEVDCARDHCDDGDCPSDEEDDD